MCMQEEVMDKDEERFKLLVARLRSADEQLETREKFYFDMSALVEVQVSRAACMFLHMCLQSVSCLHVTSAVFTSLEPISCSSRFAHTFLAIVDHGANRCAAAHIPCDR